MHENCEAWFGLTPMLEPRIHQINGHAPRTAWPVERRRQELRVGEILRNSRLKSDLSPRHENELSHKEAKQSILASGYALHRSFANIRFEASSYALVCRAPLTVALLVMHGAVCPLTVNERIM